MIGSMSKPRIVEIFEGYTTGDVSADGASGKKVVKVKTEGVSGVMNGCRRVRDLGDNGTYLTSVQSRNVFHPYLDVVLCANASGRVHVFD